MYSESHGELQIFMAIKKKNKRQSEEINLPVMFLLFPGHHSIPELPFMLGA